MEAQSTEGLLENVCMVTSLARPCGKSRCAADCADTMLDDDAVLKGTNSSPLTAARGGAGGSRRVGTGRGTRASGGGGGGCRTVSRRVVLVGGCELDMEPIADKVCEFGEGLFVSATTFISILEIWFRT